MTAYPKLGTALFVLCLLLPPAAYGQLPLPGGLGNVTQGTDTLREARAGVAIQVLTDQRAFLSDQALVRLRNPATGADQWAVTRYRSEVRFDDVAIGSYEVEVSAAGYATTISRVDLDVPFSVLNVVVMLKRDGSVSALSAPPTSGIPANVRKEAERGIQAFKIREFGKSEKHLRKAYKQYPENADLNYLLGVLYAEKKDWSQAKNYLGRAIGADPRHARSLTTMGRVLLDQKDTVGAIGYLEKSVAVDPEQWIPHWLLATGYLRRAEYVKADEAARTALRAGKGAANVARLQLGQALAELGRLPEAVAELEGFVRELPGSALVPEVRRLIAQLRVAVAEGRTSLAPGVLRAVASPSLTGVAGPDAVLPISAWGPPSVDDVKPTVAAGVTCPERRVIDGASERLQEFISSVSRFEATEEVIHEDQDEIGKPIFRETRKYSYVAEVSEPLPGMPRVEEYRHAVAGTAKFPAGIATLGLPSMAFVFHPKSRDNYDLTCEGLGQWQGQATWLVHFRQRENRPSHLLGYNTGQGIDPVDLKGRAWIAADTFQVVRMEAETIRPLPAIQLLSQHETIEYGRVKFSTKDVELWLPKQAELYFLFRGHRYYRKHAFDNFRLFSVDANDKVTPPKPNPQP